MTRRRVVWGRQFGRSDVHRKDLPWTRKEGKARWGDQRDQVDADGRALRRGKPERRDLVRTISSAETRTTLA